MVYCTQIAAQFHLSKFARSQTEHPDAGVGEAGGNDAGVLADVDRGQPARSRRIHSQRRKLRATTQKCSASHRHNNGIWLQDVAARDFYLNIHTSLRTLIFVSLSLTPSE